MRTLVFSDVHLDVTERGREPMARFVAFLRSIDTGTVNRVIVLGDLFDFWFEYRHVVFSGYFDVLRAFADLRDAGIELHFFCGNHDFWAGRFLRDELGFAIHTEPTTLPFGEQSVLLYHGDGLNPSDVGYRIYKRVARTRLARWLFGQLHPDRAMGLALRVSRTSRRATEAPTPAAGPEVEALQAHAQRLLAAGEADVVMLGHSHHPVRKEFPTPNGTGLYFNTGDWIWHQSYVEWSGGEFLLREAAAETPAKSVPDSQARQSI
jgi:UDP-2,3-diacylglucosamine hydrolase